MAIHSNDQEIIMKFALEKPAFRIIVNSASSLGAVGYTTALNPSLTLGVGTWGGSIISENVTAKHLMNIKTLAFEVNPLNKGNSVTNLDSSQTGNTSNNSESFLNKIEERLIARAGNPVVNNSFNFTQKNETSSKSVKGKSYGNGISESEIERIIREFNS